MVIKEKAMSAPVSIAQAKAGFAALVARAESGEQIVVTRNGRPVACLGPLPAKKPIVYGDLAHLGPLPEDLSLPDDVIDDFYRSAEEFEWPK
jgi:prevent-host-death family protein